MHFIKKKIPGELKNSQGIFSAVWISCPLDSVLRLALFFAAAVAPQWDYATGLLRRCS
ncbi:MAG: hypothetical protein LUK37_04385 [Clostridia bacterium]|nr:hypothetical protein [Clostridia bacterium]